MTETVYVNDNPIGETEVYHSDKYHATQRRRWGSRHVRETTVSEAQEEGLRPCKHCYPDESGDHCPGCGRAGDGDDVLANDQMWCPTPSDECRVVSFHADDGLRADGGTDSTGNVHAAILSEEEALEVADCLEGYFYLTEASAYRSTAYRAAYLAMEIRDRAGIEPNPSLLSDHPEASDGFRRESGVECYIDRPESVGGDGGESDAE